MKSSVFTWGHCRHTVTYHEGIVSVCVIMILWLSPYVLRCIGGIFYNKILYKIVLKPSERFRRICSFLSSGKEQSHPLFALHRAVWRPYKWVWVFSCKICRMPLCPGVSVTCPMGVFVLLWLHSYKCAKWGNSLASGGGRRMSGVSVCVSCGLAA